MSQSSSTRVAMKIFVISICVCAALARSQTTKSENKPVISSDESEILSAAAGKLAPNSSQHDSSLPNVSDDLLVKALNDRRFVQRQLKCATGEGPCDPIGRKIKANAPLVLRGMCTKCTPNEVKQIQHVMSHIQKNYPKEYAKMLKQYQNGF